ncbi:MAG: hypothetical protein LUI12_01780 [Clostridiales bacterium]|nr:hypothetical protein [Clostridiales bacterium]
MRGRTNILGNGNIIVNGNLEEYEVADGETVSVGDFVQVTYQSNADYTLFDNDFQKIGIQIENTNCMLIVYQNGTDESVAMKAGVFEYKKDSHNLELVSEVTVLSCLADVSSIIRCSENLYLIGGRDDTCSASVVAIKAQQDESETWYLYSSWVKVYTNTTTVWKNTMEVFSYGSNDDQFGYAYIYNSAGSSTSTTGYIWIAYNTISITDNGAEAPTIEASSPLTHQLNTITYGGNSSYPYYNSKPMSSTGSLFCLENTSDTYVYFISKHDYTYSTDGLYYISLKMTATSAASVSETKIASTYSTYYPRKLSNGIWVGLEGTTVGYLTKYLYSGTTQLSTITWGTTNVPLNLRPKDNVVCDIYSSSGAIKLDAFEYYPSTTTSTYVSTEVGDVTDTVLSGFMDLGDDIYLALVSTGYFCFYYKDGVIAEGYPELPNTVKTYDGTSTAIGFAKTGGDSGETIKVYTPKIS